MRLGRKPLHVLLFTALTLCPIMLLFASWSAEPPTVLRAICAGIVGASSSFGYLAFIAWILFDIRVPLTKGLQRIACAYAVGLGLWWYLVRQANAVESWHVIYPWIRALEVVTTLWMLWRPLVLFGEVAPLPAVSCSLGAFVEHWKTLLWNMWALPMVVIIVASFCVASTGRPTDLVYFLAAVLGLLVVPFQETLLLVLSRKLCGIPTPEDEFSEGTPG